jgi:hypothetical protein
MDHTLRLIQHNWVVLAYNSNVVILVLIIGESYTVSTVAPFLLPLQFIPNAAWIQSTPHWISSIPFSLLLWFLSAVVAIAQARIFYLILRALEAVGEFTKSPNLMLRESVLTSKW